MKIIPAIDLREGRVVRLRQGDFARQRDFSHDAVVLARSYFDAGADWLHVVDLDGARAGIPKQEDLIARMAATGVRVQAGGGVRTRAHVARLLESGVERVVVGSVAIRDPALFVEWLAEWGTRRFCLALDLRCDAAGRWRPATDAWQRDSDGDFAGLLERLVAADPGAPVLCTDISRDGMQGGPNIGLYRRLRARWPTLGWIASGGVRGCEDLDALAEAGVAACVVGSGLLDGTLALGEIASCSRVA